MYWLAIWTLLTGLQVMGVIKFEIHFDHRGYVLSGNCLSGTVVLQLEKPTKVNCKYL